MPGPDWCGPAAPCLWSAHSAASAPGSTLCLSQSTAASAVEIPTSPRRRPPELTFCHVAAPAAAAAVAALPAGHRRIVMQSVDNLTPLKLDTAAADPAVRPATPTSRQLFPPQVCRWRRSNRRLPRLALPACRHCRGCPARASRFPWPTRRGSWPCPWRPAGRPWRRLAMTPSDVEKDRWQRRLLLIQPKTARGVFSSLQTCLNRRKF